MAFRILGLDPAPFAHLYGLPDEVLARYGVKRRLVDRKPGFPDRIEVRDAEPGETVLLLNYTHQPADTAYRASHAIFVREGATKAYDAADEIPAPFHLRPISLRAFDGAGEMVAADLGQGDELKSTIEALLADPAVAYVHAHYAKPGCYAARIERA